MGSREEERAMVYWKPFPRPQPHLCRRGWAPHTLSGVGGLSRCLGGSGLSSPETFHQLVRQEGWRPHPPLTRGVLGALQVFGE